MAQRPPYERVCPEEGATGDEQTGRFFTLLKRIWDSINQDELHEIKQYLLIIDDPKFGRAHLQKVTKCVDLTRLLQDRDLLGVNNLSFIKTLLKKMLRDDLLKEVCNYEQESVNAADANPKRPKLDLRYAPSDSTCERRHLQQSIKLKNLEIQHNVQHQTNVSNTLENLKENMQEQTQIISSNKMKLTRIELEKKQKLENERTCRDEQGQIEAQIKQLQKEKRKKSELERSLIDDIDRLSQEHRDVQSLISQSTYKKNKLSKRYEGELGKKEEYSQKINNLEIELAKLDPQINPRSENLQYQPKHRQINQRSENIQCQHRQRPNSNENGSDINSELKRYARRVSSGNSKCTTH